MCVWPSKLLLCALALLSLNLLVAISKFSVALSENSRLRKLLKNLSRARGKWGGAPAASVAPHSDWEPAGAFSGL